MSKLGLAIKLLKHPVARRVILSPQARNIVFKAVKNEKVRNVVVKQMTKRLFR